MTLGIRTPTVGVVCSGQPLDGVLRAENERLTQERDLLQKTITQLELRLSMLESPSSNDQTPSDGVSDGYWPALLS